MADESMSGEKANTVLSLLRHIASNFPSEKSLQFCTGDTDTVLAGTSTTVEFSINQEFLTKVHQLYCDGHIDIVYKWVLNGVEYNLNEVSFFSGKVVQKETTITLIITNPTAGNVECSYFVAGWADHRES